MSLKALLNPERIAVVGASESRYYARSVIQNLLNAGFAADRIHPVNPRYEQVLGLACAPSLEAIGHPVDVVVAATGRDTIPGIVAEAGQAKAEIVVVLADGYAEQDEAGARLQQELEQHGTDLNVRIYGPNTLGFVVPPVGASVWAPGELRRPVKAGGVGVVFQSSGMLNLFVNLAITRDIGLSAAFSVGNEVGVSTGDLIATLAQDPQTRVIVAMVESTNHPAELAAALQLARDLGKPVVMLKLGRSERARRNAIAHTGRMASSGAAWEALLRRLGVTLVDDVDELIECAVLFEQAATAGRSSFGAAVVTVSGGDCSLIADLADRVGLELAGLEPGTHARLAELLNKPKLVGNPLDMENMSKEDEGRFFAAVDTLAADPNVDVVAYRLYLPTTPTVESRRLYERITEHIVRAGKIPVALTRAIEDLDHEWYAFFAELGAPLLPGYRPALTSLAALGRWPTMTTPAAPLELAAGSAGSRVVPVDSPPSVDGAAGVADWTTTQAFLAAAGIPYVEARLVDGVAAAVAAAEALGFPVAVKLVSRQAAHKTEIGGVELGLLSPEAVRAAVERIGAAANRAGVPVEGFEIQAMAARGVEMILGVTRDPVLGPVVMVGLGGVLAELTKDVVLMLPQMTPDDVLRELRQLAGFPLLDGYRGAPPADLAALAEVVSSLTRHIGGADTTLSELDINPLIVGPVGRGVVAVDAVLVLS
jgi:acetate---CoA ligase (ADP-forming)